MYKVDWLDSATSELAAVWTAATSAGREAIRKAVSISKIAYVTIRIQKVNRARATSESCSAIHWRLR